MVSMSSCSNSERIWCLVILGVGLLKTTTFTSAKYSDIRLSGNTNIHKGVLNVLYNGSWGTVCGSNWGKINKDVACRHLGYPNASSVIAEGGRVGNGFGDIQMGDVQCNGDENYLWDCTHTQNPSCNHNEDINLVCHIPGYLGCYGNNRTDWVLNARHFRSTALTIMKCMEFCKQEGFPLAGLGNANDCYCGSDKDVYDRLGQFDDSTCDYQCTGSKDDACGGLHTLSIYNVSAGFCEDLKAPLGGWYKGDSTFFGQTVTFGCNNGVRLIGNDVIQCVLGGAPRQVQWSAPAPYCFGVTAPPSVSAVPNSQPTLLQENAVIIWSIAGVAGFLIMVSFVIVIWSIRSMNRRNSPDPEQLSVDFDLEPAGPSGTYRHSLHSLHLLGNVQDNEQNSAHEKQRNAPMYLREEVKGGVGMQANALTVLPTRDEDDLEWDENMDLDSDLEVDPRTSSIEYVGRTAL